MSRRILGLGIALLLVGAVLYLPIRRAVIQHGLAPAGTFVSKEGISLTFFDSGVYVRSVGGTETRGRFEAERFVDTPRISHLRLSDGEVLHVRYDEGAYQLENISQLSSGDTDYKRR